MSEDGEYTDYSYLIGKKVKSITRAPFPRFETECPVGETRVVEKAGPNWIQFEGSELQLNPRRFVVVEETQKVFFFDGEGDSNGPIVN